MKLLHVYPALAKITELPRLRCEAVTVAGVDLHVFRGHNVYLDSATGAVRFAKHDADIYCVEVAPGLLVRIGSAGNDEVLAARLTTPAKFGPSAGKTPIEGLPAFKAEYASIAVDCDGYTSRARAEIAEKRAARELEETRKKAEREEREQRETVERIARNTALFIKGDSIDWNGFEELCNLHGVTMAIQTLGSCRKNVSAVRKTGISVGGGAKPDHVFRAIRALTAALSPLESSSEVA